MKENIIGREREQQILEERLSSGRAEFIAVCVDDVVWVRPFLSKSILKKRWCSKQPEWQEPGKQCN